MIRKMTIIAALIAAGVILGANSFALASEGTATVRVSYTSKANGIFPVRVVKINDQESGMARQREVIDVPAGEQSLTVLALVDERWVTGTQRQIDFDSSQTVTYNFEAGKTYYIAAQMPRNANDMKIIVGEWGTHKGQ